MTALSAMHMRDNIIIHGLCNDESTENPTETLQTFLEEIMCLTIDATHILTAKRTGKGVPGKPDILKPMLATVHPTLRNQIFDNLGNLKDKLNDHGKSYRIFKQMPDQWVEEKRKLGKAVAKAHKTNESKINGEQKDDIQVKNRTLFINKVPQKLTYLNAPKPGDVFVEKGEQDRLDKIKYSVSSTIEEEGSSFQAYALKLQSITEV